MNLIKDLLTIFSLVYLLYTTASNNAKGQSATPLWICVGLLVAIALVSLFPHAKNWIKKSWKKRQDKKILDDTTNLLKRRVEEIKPRFEEFRKLVCDQSFAYAFGQALRAGGHPNSNPEVQRRFTEANPRDYMASISNLVSRVNEPQFALIEMANCFTRVQGQISGLWREVDQATKDSDMARQFVHRYNQVGAELEGMFRVHGETIYTLEQGALANFSINYHFDRL
jgi:hypothetical protein